MTVSCKRGILYEKNRSAIHIQRDQDTLNKNIMICGYRHVGRKQYVIFLSLIARGFASIKANWEEMKRNGLEMVNTGLE